jgi:hypothetical protein
MYLLQNVQTASGAHPADSVRTAGSFLHVKPSGRNADHSRSSAEVTNKWSHASAPPICVDVIDKDFNNFPIALIHATQSYSIPAFMEVSPTHSAKYEVLQIFKEEEHPKHNKTKNKILLRTECIL